MINACIILELLSSTGSSKSLSSNKTGFGTLANKNYARLNITNLWCQIDFIKDQLIMTINNTTIIFTIYRNGHSKVETNWMRIKKKEKELRRLN
jgi:hypothetical protein